MEHVKHMRVTDDDDLDEQSERINARLDDLRASFRDSFDEYAAACLKIRTKSGAIAPLILNRSQFYLHQRLEEQRKEKGRVRALVLKARQVGISTYIGGRKYWRTTHGRGLRAFILTHLDVASENLFDIAKRFHDNCPASFKPQTGSANQGTVVSAARQRVQGGHRRIEFGPMPISTSPESCRPSPKPRAAKRSLIDRQRRRQSVPGYHRC